MPNASWKEKKRAAWEKAKADVDAVESAALGSRKNREEHSRREGRLLDRLRHEEYADQVADAWLSIERHQKATSDGQRVIRCLLRAWTLSDTASLVPDDYRRSLEHLKGLKACVARLYSYFSDEILRDPMWKVVGDAPSVELSNFRHVIASLRRAESFLESRIDESIRAFDEIGLTRELKAKRARRVVFSAALGNSMRDIFGKPLDGVVQTLTDVAFDTETTIDQVKHARMNAARRKRRTQNQKILPSAP